MQSIFGIAFIIVGAMGAMCPSGRLSDSDRTAVLNAHNTRRSSLAKGLERSAIGGRAPPASQMYKMTYDCSLESSAQAYADRCNIGVHSGGSGYGENLYWSSGSSLSVGGHLQQAAALWWGELAQYGISDSSNRLTSAVFNSGVGHFTQMAWWTTTKVGCGVANCGGTTQVVCQYSPPGNYINQVIYPVGSACTANSQCTAIAGSVCSVSEGLCLDPIAQGSGSSSGGATTTAAPSGTCTDVATNCAQNLGLCNNSLYKQIMMQQCKKTCGFCSTPSGGGCRDVATNCAQSANLCNDSVYYQLMTQQCPRTCGRC